MLKLFAFLCCIVFVSSCVSSKKNDVDENALYRPLYHYSPPQNWTNDPNGLVYLEGEYHLFYQYNPYGNQWGHMSWAHAVSKDLQTWENLPLALPEFDNPDGSHTMIFSGCVVVDSLNTSGLFAKGVSNGLVAVFTSHVTKKGKDIAQHQSLAYSSDKGRTWKYYTQNPVLDIGSTNFRDPNVFWYQNKWVMVVVKATEYTVQFYESQNLKDWHLLSEFGKQGDMTRIWECPSLTQMPVEDGGHRWVLMLSSGHRQSNYLAMQYFVGDFDGKTFKPQKQEGVFYVDEGKDFYAGIPFSNLPSSQPNPIMIGWLNDWEYANQIPTNTWRGAFSLPRKLSLYQQNNIYYLRQTPLVPEKVYTQSITLTAGDKLPDNLLQEQDNSYHLRLTIKLLNTKNFNLNLLQNGEEKSILSYDVTTQMLSFDRRKSGKVDFHKRFPSVESVKVKSENNELLLDIFVDKSVVEIYANEGKQVMTDLVFPTHASGRVSL